MEMRTEKKLSLSDLSFRIEVLKQDLAPLKHGRIAENLNSRDKIKPDFKIRTEKVI